MEEKNKKGKDIIIGILIGIIIILVIALIVISYIKSSTPSCVKETITSQNSINDEIIEKENAIDTSKENNSTQINGMSDMISKKKAAYGSLEKFFENYVKNVPLKYDSNSNLVSYSVSDLTDKEISMAVWRYIYNSKNGITDNSKLTKEEVYSYIDIYLNLNNYSLKTMSISEDNIFGLEENNGIYKISASQTEFSFPNFEITDVTYDLYTGKVNVNGNQYSLQMGTGNKINESKINLEIMYNGTNGAFNLIKMTVSK